MQTSVTIGRFTVSAALALTLAWLPGSAGSRPRATDAAVRVQMIRDSIASYPGSCPCPYNSARNGSRCGGRSAYNRAGGYAPLCFASNISKQAVDAYRQQNGL